jgi:N6-L-threonylcarbamoyladenine synthase
MKQASTILGIESSCDDTAAAVLQNGQIVSNITSTQKVHEIYGGVVPELASRAHQSSIIPVIDVALKTANISLTDLTAVAVTQGPGLMGSLMVGLNTAKALSMSLKIPLIGVNHLQAHVAALYIEHQVQFPMLCLLVSGGHTQLIWVTNYMEMEVIGSTIDDAVGEAFDKAGKLLGLGYPGGPQISKLAQSGDPSTYKFPDSSLPEYQFSFSGIKTSLLYFLRDNSKNNADFAKENLENICASYEIALVNMLTKRVKKAIKNLNPKSIGLVGGVSANSVLRNAMVELGKLHEKECYIPDFEYCTDNAGMIAKAGSYLLEKNQFIDISTLPFSKNKT